MMDYFNFCDPRLKPSISSSVVCAEGYEVRNLISQDSNIRQRGFMAYHTINPPVNVYFNFMCKININHIIIWPQVGSQKSNAFQVHTSPEVASNSSDLSFVNVGTGFLQNEPGIIFYYTVEPSKDDIKNFVRRKLFSKNNSLCAVHSLKLRIIRTHHSTVPAIKKVEVWGLPSVSCSREVRLQVLALWTEKNKVQSCIQNEKRSKEENRMRMKAKTLEKSNLKIPEEFMDQITCDMMVLPYTLPSGKDIDQSTLEIHKNHEANWGRRPSDPFTGKLFTDTSKPMFNAALKARIDKFLSEHSEFDEIKTFPRTVGKRPLMKEGNTICSVQLTSDETSAQNYTLNVIDGNSCLSTDTKVDYNNQPVVLKNKETQVKERSKRIKLPDDEPCREIKCCVGSKVKCHINTCEISCENQVLPDHEDNLNDSLDVALKNALSHLPSFTNFSQTVNVYTKKCCECGENKLMYVLPCHHFLCRACLMKKTKEMTCSCSLCNLTFTTSDPKRCHS